jgi:hypothetical protein
MNKSRKYNGEGVVKSILGYAKENSKVSGC